MDIACLVGNGLSVSYNSRLATRLLTDELLDFFSQLAGQDGVEAIKEFATTAINAKSHDFETLLGPLDAVSRAVSIFGQIEGLFRRHPQLSSLVMESSNIIGHFHQAMFSEVLRIIDDHAHGQGADSMKRVKTLTDGLLAAVAKDRLFLGTLNYDCLLIAALPQDTLVDLAEGRDSGSIALGDGLTLKGRPLRTQFQLPASRKVILLNLHGALNWLRVSQEGDFKFRIGDLRKHEIWDRLRQNKLRDVKPLVVLTNYKENDVLEFPFSLAYEEFGKHLERCQYWCVVGYGFRDEPVNRLFQQAIQQRSKKKGKTRVLVVMKGRDKFIYEQAGRIFDSLCETYYDISGTPDCVNGVFWNEWLKGFK